MKTIDPWSPYKDSLGFVHPTPREISGNGIRYTAEYLCALDRHHNLTPEIISKYTSIFRLCEREQGLLMRHPTNPSEQEGPDDYVGWGLAAKILNRPDMAERVLQYGQKHFFMFNNTDKSATASAFLGRQPQVLAHLCYAAGYKPPLLLETYWAAAIYISKFAKPSDQDAWALSWALVKTAKGYDGITEAARKRWIIAFKCIHPRGMGQILGDYFGDYNHPTVDSLMWDFGE